jgi:hypothetical protein
MSVALFRLRLVLFCCVLKIFQKKSNHNLVLSLYLASLYITSVSFQLVDLYLARLSLFFSRSLPHSSIVASQLAWPVFLSRLPLVHLTFLSISPTVGSRPSGPPSTCLSRTLRRQRSPCANFILRTLMRFAHTARLYSSRAPCFAPESRTLMCLNSAPPAWQSCLHTPGRLARTTHLARATCLARLCTSVCCARAASYLAGRDARPPACMSAGRLTPLRCRARSRTHPCVVPVLIGRP